MSSKLSSQETRAKSGSTREKGSKRSRSGKSSRKSKASPDGSESVALAASVETVAKKRSGSKSRKSSSTLTPESSKTERTAKTTKSTKAAKNVKREIGTLDVGNTSSATSAPTALPVGKTRRRKKTIRHRKLLPKRAQSGYLFFSKYYRKELKTKFPEMVFSEQSKQTARKWKQMNEDEKKEFNYMAQKDKERFEREKSKIPVKPLKPKNSFMAFAGDHRDSVIRDHPDWKMGQIQKQLGDTASREASPPTLLFHSFHFLSLIVISAQCSFGASRLTSVSECIRDTQEPGVSSRFCASASMKPS